MKHRTITGLVAVALLLVAAATAAAIKPLSTDRTIAATGATSLQGVTVGVARLRTDDDKFAGAKKPVRYEAVIANWKRYRSETQPNK